MKLTDPTDLKISTLHKSAQKKARDAVKAALSCGALLLKKRALIEHGDWGDYLHRVGINDETARRYMMCAERKQQLKSGLADGTSLMALYRSFGILPELEGGGARDGKDATGGGHQLFFDPSLFGGFMRVLDSRKGNPFTDLPKTELVQTREQTAKALKMIDAAIAKSK